jgi:hypothetical protein
MVLRSIPATVSVRFVTGPKDWFEVHEISREEYEALHR